MADTPTSGVQIRWEPVADPQGRVRLEMRWAAVPTTPEPQQRPADPHITHAA